MTDQDRIKQFESRLAYATSFADPNGKWDLFQRSATEWVVTAWPIEGEDVFTSQEEAFAMVENAKL